MNKEQPIEHIINTIRRRNRNRLWITVITLLILLGIVLGLGYAMVVGVTVTSAWKELLLLILGAFIGAYSKVMDYWFSDTEKDMLLIEQITGRARYSVSNISDIEIEDLDTEE